MKIVTWNVNSLRVRIDHLLEWLKENPVDVIGLQETKLIDDKFPADEINAAGYDVCFAGQPTYNGVALLTRKETVGPATDVVVGNPHYPDKQQRLITGTCNGLRITCAYVPNGQEVGSEKYEYKLGWLDALIKWIEEPDYAKGLPRVVMGDFNIAPDDRDVHDPAAWEGKVLCSEAERQRFEQILDLGLIETFRLFEQEPKLFSWWDYRRLGFRRNAGMKIDHILVEKSLAESVNSCHIDKVPRKWEKPSDHAPVVIDLSI